MKKNPLPLRGHGLFVFLYTMLTRMRDKGVLATMTYYTTGVAIVTLAYAWKARQVIHWRLSPRLSKAAFEACMVVCRTCKTLKVVDDGRFPDRESLYCGSCGCTDWKWAELFTKCGREGHYCPLGLHEGSEFNRKKKGCVGCGGKPKGEPSGNGHADRPLADLYVTRGVAMSTRGQP